jgi:hypothetical protein
MAATMALLMASWWASFVLDVCKPVVLTEFVAIEHNRLCSGHLLGHFGPHHEGLYASFVEHSGEPIGLLVCDDDSMYMGLHDTGVLRVTIDQVESMLLQRACGAMDAMEAAMMAASQESEKIGSSDEVNHAADQKRQSLVANTHS